MGLFGALGGLGGLGSLLQQYTGGGQPQGDVNEHFDHVAGAVPSSSLASGLAAALGSGGTGGFAQMAGQLFSSGAPGDHQVNLLNTLMSSVGPEVLQQFAGNNAGSALAGLLGGGQTRVTPGQASQVSQEEVQALAAHVHQNNPGIIGRVSEIYSEHPTAIKALGAAALILAVRHIASRHAASA
jgi:hypothetical protein